MNLRSTNLFTLLHIDGHWRRRDAGQVTVRSQAEVALDGGVPMKPPSSSPSAPATGASRSSLPPQRPSRSLSLAPSSSGSNPRRKSLSFVHPFDGEDAQSTAIRFRRRLSRVERQASKEEDHQVEGDCDDDLPFPGYVRKAFFVFEQTTAPRSWCLTVVNWPYPLLTRFIALMLLYLWDFQSISYTGISVGQSMVASDCIIVGDHVRGGSWLKIWGSIGILYWAYMYVHLLKCRVGHDVDYSAFLHSWPFPSSKQITQNIKMMSRIWDDVKLL